MFSDLDAGKYAFVTVAHGIGYADEYTREQVLEAEKVLKNVTNIGTNSVIQRSSESMRNTAMMMMTMVGMMVGRRSSVCDQ